MQCQYSYTVFVYSSTAFTITFGDLRGPPPEFLPIGEKGDRRHIFTLDSALTRPILQTHRENLLHARVENHRFSLISDFFSPLCDIL